MTTLNVFDRHFLADMLCREGITAVLSELAWLQTEADMTKLLADPPVPTSQACVRPLDFRPAGDVGSSFSSAR
jgi:hypothetical protein